MSSGKTTKKCEGKIELPFWDGGVDSRVGGGPRVPVCWAKPIRAVSRQRTNGVVVFGSDMGVAFVSDLIKFSGISLVVTCAQEQRNAAEAGGRQLRRKLYALQCPNGAMEG